MSATWPQHLSLFILYQKLQTLTGLKDVIKLSSCQMIKFRVYFHHLWQQMNKWSVNADCVRKENLLNNTSLKRKVCKGKAVCKISYANSATQWSLSCWQGCKILDWTWFIEASLEKSQQAKLTSGKSLLLTLRIWHITLIKVAIWAQEYLLELF